MMHLLLNLGLTYVSGMVTLEFSTFFLIGTYTPNAGDNLKVRLCIMLPDT
jgi:hypothetical protein